MNYSEHIPSAPLRPYIDCFWILESSDGEKTEAAPILPDGRMELVINYGDPFHQIRDNGSTVTQPRSFLVGQMTSRILVEPARRAGILAVRFRPGGAYTFFPFRQSEITDQVVGMDLLWGSLAREVEEQIARARSTQERIDLLESVLISRLCARMNGRLDSAIMQIGEADGLIAIEDLATRLGVTRRNLERQFNQHVGLSPKMFARILRFQRIFRTLEEKRLDEWTTLALDCGYYDQAHFIREFREFSGKNPSSYFASEAELSKFFTRGRVVKVFESAERAG